MSDRLQEVSNLAAKYAEIALRDKREEKPLAKDIVNQCAKFSPLEMAYFCLQVASYCDTTHKACSILTAFTNRLSVVTDPEIEPKVTKVSDLHDIHAFLERTHEVTKADLATGHGRDYLAKNAMEELGEYCAACTIEDGIKTKPLKESAKQEAVDVIICALSLFYAEGGTDTELAEYGMVKLQKWIDRIPKQDS